MKNEQVIDLSEIINENIDSVSTYQYYKGLEKRRIVLNEEITEQIVEKIMLPLLDMDNDGTNKPIEIYLSSVGGSLLDGMNLCAIIDKLKTPTTIIAPTYCYSMGGMILMAGKNNPNVTKKCYPYTTALIHAGSSYFEGNAASVRDTFHFYERIEDLVKEYVLSHTDISEEEYDKKTRYEWYLTADEMLEKGLVDEII